MTALLYSGTQVQIVIEQIRDKVTVIDVLNYNSMISYCTGFFFINILYKFLISPHCNNRHFLVILKNILLFQSSRNLMWVGSRRKITLNTIVTHDKIKYIVFMCTLFLIVYNVYLKIFPHYTKRNILQHRVVVSTSQSYAWKR